MRILIIGAGPGGYETAVEAMRRGFEVTVVNDGPLGGTCLNVGCIPTKSLIHSCCVKKEPLKTAQEGKRQVISQLQDGIAALLKKADVVEGHASFTGPHSVKVGESTLTADKIIIAGGSVPSQLPVPGAGYTVDSAQLLDCEEVPERLVVIGGGVIGLEMAGIFNALGTAVTVLEFLPCILPRFDSDMAKRLKQQLVKSGIKIVTKAEVTSVAESSGGAYTVAYKSAEEVCSIEADKVLMAVGRRPAVEGLGLEAAGVAYDRKGIKVDGNMRTSVPGIYAIGDVTGGMMLAHVATAQGLRALDDICGKNDNIDFSCVPSVVFTRPEFASVGKTEEDCKAEGVEYTVLRSNYRANGKAVTEGETEGCCKFIAGSDGRLLGCHILGAHAADLIGEATALIALNATVEQAGWLIHAHPTVSEVLQSCFRQ